MIEWAIPASERGLPGHLFQKSLVVLEATRGRMLVSYELIYETVNKEWNEKLVLIEVCSSKKKCTQKKNVACAAPKQKSNKSGWSVCGGHCQTYVFDGNRNRAVSSLVISQSQVPKVCSIYSGVSFASNTTNCFIEFSFIYIQNLRNNRAHSMG